MLSQKSQHFIAEEKFGRTVAYVDGKITSNKLEDIAGKKKLVDPKCQEVQAARDLGISFGDEA